MNQKKFTATEKKYVDTYGKDVCIAAYKQHRIGGSGGNTVGEIFLYGIVKPSQYTRSGDILINAGRKLTENKQ